MDNTSTVSTTLSNPNITKSPSRTLFYILLLMLALFILIWLTQKQTISYNPPKMKQIEGFNAIQGGDDVLISLKAQLTAPNDENGNPQHFAVGEAIKFVSGHSFNLDVYCNLFTLGGNIFYKQPDTQNNIPYKVYLYNTLSNKVYIGDLIRDGDGIYKLKYKSNTVHLKQMKYIDIYFGQDKVLTGKF